MVNGAQKILALPATAIVCEMTAYPEFQVLCLAYIYYFSFLIMEVIHPWCVGELLHLLFRQIRGKGLLLSTSFYETIYMWQRIVGQ